MQRWVDATVRAVFEASTKIPLRIKNRVFECGSRVAGFVFPDVSNECIVFIVMG